VSKSNFSKNLRIACDQQRSVAHVCRLLEINRQQFNKYLSGQVFPSNHNLASICEFFDISKDTFLLPERDFQHVLDDQQRDSGQIKKSHVDRVIESLPNNIDAMSRYEGFYNSYFHALGYPGYICRALIYIYREGDRFYSKNIEHMWDKALPGTAPNRFKYVGTVNYLSDRIFITEFEVLTKQSIAHTILVPSYRNTVSMSGVTLGVASLNSHLPKACLVEYQYLGKQIDIRAALRNCGLFSVDSDVIHEGIKQRIKNQILPHQYMLTGNE
jgi:transcriptional regulator with XRE-family HTH domain